MSLILVGCLVVYCLVFFFFFKQKTAYEMRISDWSSDVCSSDLDHPRVVAIGETGLDYYYDHSDRTRQQMSFRAHIAAARETGLPLIVHTRDAEEDTALILAEEMGKGAFTGVIHCFTASQDFAHKALELGLFISISGIVTFKNARDLQDTASRLPGERLLIETDAPFLAPVPKRGKPCEPAVVPPHAPFCAQFPRPVSRRVGEEGVVT